MTYQRGHGNESPSPFLKQYLEERTMSCLNPECFCKGCSCAPCMCTEDKPCGCDPDVKGVPPIVEWKQLDVLEEIV